MSQSAAGDFVKSLRDEITRKKEKIQTKRNLLQESLDLILGFFSQCDDTEVRSVRNFEINEQKIECDIENLNPIKLTEEILLKCGFEKVKNKIDIFEKKRLRLFIGSRGQFLAYLIEEDTTSAHYINSYEYLHQLQNLYFALTGEELKINL